MKKGSLWAVAEFWSWIALFILIFLSLIFFKACSAPRLQVIQGDAVTMLQSRQEALFVMETPVVYRGQNTTLAYLVSLGSTKTEFEKVLPVIKSALDRVGGYQLKIVYADRFELVGEGSLYLDQLSVPTPTGLPIQVVVYKPSPKYVNNGPMVPQ